MSELIKSTGNEFKFYNTATVAGKLVYKGTLKDANVFTISVKTYRGKEPMFTNIAVYFEGALGKTYDTLYEVGDMVAVSGLCQKFRNQTLARDEVKIYGLTMTPKTGENYFVKDQRIVNIRGRIAKTVVISNELLLVYLYTNVHKTYKNPNKESDKEFFEDDYISETPIAILRRGEGEHDAILVARELTKGTWLDVSGWINTKRKELKNGKHITEQQLVAKNVFIIGEIQKDSANAD